MRTLFVLAAAATFALAPLARASVARAGDDTDRIYGYRGNSFVAVVEFGDRVRAKSLLAGGQSRVRSIADH